jgi:uncharacterized tellurite resistance protein B-like protein
MNGEGLKLFYALYADGILFYRNTKTQMENTVILKGYSDQEKGAYLGAIASLATADKMATKEELDQLAALADAAEISAQQKEMVLRAAKEITPEELNKCMEILRTSELRFSLIAELISFAQTDGHYGEEERRSIEEMAKQLNVNERQFSLLDSFVDKANKTAEQPEQKAGFLDSLGLGDKFKSEGMNLSGISKGLLAVAAPFFLGNLFRRKLSGRAGGLSPFGGFGAGAGLGSVLSGLSMGRGFGHTGGLLGRMFGRRV